MNKILLPSSTRLTPSSPNIMVNTSTNRPQWCLLTLVVLGISPGRAFVGVRRSDGWRHHTSDHRHHTSAVHQQRTLPISSAIQLARYGPQDAQPGPGGDDDKTKADFSTLLDIIISSEAPEDLPSILTQNVETILAAMGTEGLIEEVIQEDVQRTKQLDNNDKRLDQLSAAVNVIVSFAETFVEQAKSMDDVYKQLLGKIFQSIAPNKSEESLNLGVSSLESDLDELLAREEESFTPGFLRHVEGECNRIAALPTLSPESSKMLQILRLIQTRILEELGKVRICGVCSLMCIVALGRALNPSFY